MSRRAVNRGTRALDEKDLIAIFTFFPGSSVNAALRLRNGRQLVATNRLLSCALHLIIKIKGLLYFATPCVMCSSALAPPQTLIDSKLRLRENPAWGLPHHQFSAMPGTHDSSSPGQIWRSQAQRRFRPLYAAAQLYNRKELPQVPPG